MFDFPIQVYAASALIILALPLMWWSVSAPRNAEKMAKRLQAGYSTDLREAMLARPASERLVSPLLERLAGVVRRFSAVGFVEAAERRLALAGLSGTWPVDRLLGMKLLLGGGAAAYGLIRYVAAPGMDRLVFAIVITVAGFWGLDYLLGVRARRRQRQISIELPDVLDQMTVAVEAGLGFEPAMMHIIDHVEGPVSEEFKLAIRDVRLGMSRELAFRGMVERTDAPELRGFVSALVQADKLGTPLVQVLRNQAAEMRTIRRQRAEEEAQKLPLKMIFPLVLCILPALIMVLIGPAVMQAIEGWPLR